ncbi:E3 ubiquitin-protein ligase PUB23-like [Diospyros lotus]|uniref:E3 ubiquitin-protein ligase PUB23-like n=1 Tax=Diospyros lotus TaxID=55363 RepID=UPI0022599EA2|nr:E3 ubiquitin-protein ligase PUB23-like [Diospyros lotus]
MEMGKQAAGMDDEIPPDFRCPISMELMQDPVTISTGLTYERKNIERWFFSYRKGTCPATMQKVFSFDMTPNHTLKRLILAWQNDMFHSRSSPDPQTPASVKHQELVSLLNAMESTPFKVSSLRKLRSIVAMGDEMRADFRQSGGVEVIVRTLTHQINLVVESSDFSAFRACEEALAVLHHLSLSEEDDTIQLLLKPEALQAMALMLQRGSLDARVHAISMFQKLTCKADNLDLNLIIQDQGLDFLKSILELVSDEICTKASSCALQVLIDILGSSKHSRLKAIEAGAVCVLIELLPDSNRSKSEKIMHLIKLLCDCADGRLAFIDHSLGIAAISKKMLHVSHVATKMAVQILWRVCTCHTGERVLEEMLVYGAVKKLVAFLHIHGRSSTKDKVVKVLKLHGNSWSRNPCLPRDLKDYLARVS